MPATKDEIARNFMLLASRYGYRRTTVADVVRALRISKKTVYDFFADKEELCRYAVELSASEQRRRVESMLTSKTALERVLEAMTVALADVRRFVETSPDPELAAPSDITEQVNARIFAPMVRELIAAGVTAGELTVLDIEFTTACCMAIGMEAVRIIREDPSRRPEGAALDAIHRLLAGQVCRLETCG